MRGRSTALIAALLLSSVAVVSCAKAGRPAGAPGASAGGAGYPRRPPTIGFADGAAPRMARTGLALAGACVVEDYTDDLAAFTRIAEAPRLTDSFGLLDLATGRSALVRTEPVNVAEHWDAFSPRISDRFMVWEEVTPGEGNDMGHAGWRLYAAPIDRVALKAGDPVLVAQGRTETLQRPLYGVDGSTVYWTMTASPAAPLRGVTPDAVMARDLASGATRTVHEAAAIDGFKLSTGTIVVTESRRSRTAPAESDLTAVAIRASDGHLLASRPLRNRFALSHFADWADGWFAWTESPQDGAEPTAYVMDPAGRVVRAAPLSVNPMVSSDYAFCESREMSGSPTAQREVRVLRGFALATMTRFELSRTLTDTEGGWHTTVAGSRPSTLVVYNDAWALDAAIGTSVRVYRW